MLSIADIDRFLSRQGHFCLIDWLLAENTLPYAHYEAWRYGDQAYLDDSLHLDQAQLATLLQAAQEHCDALGLSGEEQDFHSWSAQSPGRLLASRQADIHRQLTRKWLRPRDVPQFDLFMDNAAVIAENLLCDALAGRQFDRAAEQLLELTRLNSEHARLGSYQDLVNYGQHLLANPHIDPAHLNAELAGLQQEVAPLARDVLGSAARDYLAFAWRRLADNLLPQVFDPQQPELHASFALAQIPDWQAVREQLQTEPALYRQPLLLERMAEACAALQEDEQALLHWCLLFERQPDYAEKAIRAHSGSTAINLWQDFGELEDKLDQELSNTWFGAFVLAKRPGLIHHLDGHHLDPSHPDSRLTEPANQAMLALLRARHDGADEVPARQQLKSLHPLLLAMYKAI
ncbi:MAG: hypothetical protein GYB33_18210 [Gammaproteobacteria bacterium]|nr:hypothetical protein [Gammaproteobacteria bacterium]